MYAPICYHLSGVVWLSMQVRPFMATCWDTLKLIRAWHAWIPDANQYKDVVACFYCLQAFAGSEHAGSACLSFGLAVGQADPASPRPYWRHILPKNRLKTVQLSSDWLASLDLLSKV